MDDGAPAVGEVARNRSLTALRGGEGARPPGVCDTGEAVDRGDPCVCDKCGRSPLVRGGVTAPTSGAAESASSSESTVGSRVSATALPARTRRREPDAPPTPARASGASLPADRVEDAADAVETAEGAAEGEREDALSEEIRGGEPAGEREDRSADPEEARDVSGREPERDRDRDIPGEPRARDGDRRVLRERRARARARARRRDRERERARARLPLRDVPCEAGEAGVRGRAGDRPWRRRPLVRRGERERRGE